MNIELTEAVVLDLLPLYLGQSASEDTRRLVEAYLAANPALATRFASQPATASSRAEQQTLRRARAALRQRSFNLAFAIACTLAPLTFWVEDGPGGVHSWMMVRNLPSLACAFWVMAAGFWIGYAIWARRTRATGL
jgi:anti-sigma factor RsiW